MWFKCNIDGAANGALGSARENGVFRDRQGQILGCLLCLFGNKLAYMAEL